MILDHPGGFLRGDIRIFNAQVVGVGDLAGEAFAAVVLVVPDEPGVGICDAPLGSLVLQTVFRGVPLQPDGLERLEVRMPV